MIPSFFFLHSEYDLAAIKNRTEPLAQSYFLFYRSTFGRFAPSGQRFSYMQLVTPSVVPSAVSIDTNTCTINFQVSRFITSLFYYVITFSCLSRSRLSRQSYHRCRLRCFHSPRPLERGRG